MLTMLALEAEIAENLKSEDDAIWNLYNSRRYDG